MKTLGRFPRAYLWLLPLCSALFMFANLRIPLVNDDGVIYLLFAQRISDDGLGSVFSMYDRPFYSWLIATIHALSGLSLHASALCLDAMLAFVLVYCFVQFCCLLYQDRRVLPWAALVILAYPKLNNYFGFVFRDMGYWALLFASFVALMRYVASARLAWLALWALCTLLAAAFRPDALIVGTAVAVALAFTPGLSRGKALLRVPLAWFGLFAPLVLMVVLLIIRRGEFSAIVRDVLQVLMALWHKIPDGFESAAERYAQTVLDSYSNHVAGLSLAGGLLVILIAKTLNTLGPLQCLLLGVGMTRGQIAPAHPYRALYVAALVATVLPAAGFIAYRQFLDTRYVMIVCLLALAPVARYLQQLAETRSARGRTAAVTFFAAVAIAFCADFALGLDKPKPYLIECADWVSENLPAGSSVFSNDRQLAWASQSRWNWQTTFLANKLIADRKVPLAGNDYWIIHVKRDQPALQRELRQYAAQLTPLHQCKDPRGASIEIFAQKPVP